MTRWAPARADIIGEFADEILHNYRSARAIVGVDGVPGADQAAFADDLAEAFRERGSSAVRASAELSHAEEFVDEVAKPFRAEPGAGVLVVDGTRLHDPTFLPVFAYTIWLTVPHRDPLPASDEQSAYERRTSPRARATANVDNSDPEHPRRTFADSC
ncbi:hypothetical protein [Herbiconiux sp. L3-i23]|uniref:hypothetical protein n=1 Tax=Herbiconiux sp. L3-i23 TaxID=2905871 RepID=UPI00205B2211|nr:hypothetical protein [Herbiconiux sp. L3-i23]BDI22067.1 hypothetical protein L3i23_08430 [Herbiconiux sp. L3-i23]